MSQTTTTTTVTLPALLVQLLADAALYGGDEAAEDGPDIAPRVATDRERLLAMGREEAREALEARAQVSGDLRLLAAALAAITREQIHVYVEGYAALWADDYEAEARKAATVEPEDDDEEDEE